MSFHWLVLMWLLEEAERSNKRESLQFLRCPMMLGAGLQQEPRPKKVSDHHTSRLAWPASDLDASLTIARKRVDASPLFRWKSFSGEQGEEIQCRPRAAKSCFQPLLFPMQPPLQLTAVLRENESCSWIVFSLRPR